MPDTRLECRERMKLVATLAQVCKECKVRGTGSMLCHIRGDPGWCDKRSVSVRWKNPLCAMDDRWSVRRAILFGATVIEAIAKHDEHYYCATARVVFIMLSAVARLRNSLAVSTFRMGSVRNFVCEVG